MSKAKVAVLKVVTKELSVTAAAARYGYSRQHLHRLLARYHEAGLEAVEPRSRRPDSNSNATTDPTPSSPPAATGATNKEARADGPGFLSHKSRLRCHRCLDSSQRWS